jgi:hypothetical protein
MLWLDGWSIMGLTRILSEPTERWLHEWMYLWL